MTELEVREYLENYRQRKTIAEFKIKQGLAEDREVKCVQGIESCLSTLPDGLGEILTLIYLGKKSIRQISKELYYSRTTLARRRDEAIALIAQCLAVV